MRREVIKSGITKITDERETVVDMSTLPTNVRGQKIMQIRRKKELCHKRLGLDVSEVPLTEL